MSRKKKVVIWYSAKSDYLVELNPNESYALIIMLVQWNPMFDRNDWMLLGSL